jgi:hypothetical protein
MTVVSQHTYFLGQEFFVAQTESYNETLGKKKTCTKAAKFL